MANGCNVQVTPLASGDGEVSTLMDRFHTAVAAHPEVAKPKVMLLQHTFVSDGPAETDRLVQDLSAFYCAFGAWFLNRRPVSRGFMEPLTPEERAEVKHFSPEAIARNLVIGEPDAVVARLKAYEAMGVDQFSVWIDSGISHERKRKSLDLFVRHVMPAFR